jgi:hypothetical protein
MTHVFTCANSVLTHPSKCRCSCEQALHGVPHTERGRAFFRADDQRGIYANTIVVGYRRAMEAAEPPHRMVAVTDYLASKFTEEAIEAHLDPRDLLTDVATAAFSAVLDRVGEVSDSDARRVKAALRNDHIYCAIAVLLLKAADAAKAVRDDLRDAAVEGILDSVFGPSEHRTVGPVGRAIVAGAIKAGFDAGMKALDAATGASRWLIVIRLLGLLTCPNVDTHPNDDVTTHCVLPLTTAFLTDTFAAWVRARFPAGAVPDEQSPMAA